MSQRFLCLILNFLCICRSSKMKCWTQPGSTLKDGVGDEGLHFSAEICFDSRQPQWLFTANWFFIVYINKRFVYNQLSLLWWGCQWHHSTENNFCLNFADLFTSLNRSPLVHHKSSTELKKKDWKLHFRTSHLHWFNCELWKTVVKWWSTITAWLAYVKKMS